jgi:leucyl-tRNA synthetase
VHEAADAKGSVDGQGLRRTTHKTIAAVTDDLNNLRFNRAIARIYELSNALGTAIQSGVDAKAVNEAAKTLISLSAPMMPHLAEECWKIVGGSGAVVDTPWPKADAALIVDDEVTMAIQINGKRRDEITVAKGLGKAELEPVVLAREAVIRVLDGKAVKKFIVVPDRIINIVC